MTPEQVTRCGECGGVLPRGYESCNAVFDAVCALEYGDLDYGSVHLLTVDAYTLQHSAKRGPRSNAFHLMRLCLLLEYGANPGIGQRPPRDRAKAFERQLRGFPYLSPPEKPGDLTICDVIGAEGPDEHALRVRKYALSVWEAWCPHHTWAREWAARGGFA
jgi:hypothetical protein